MIVGISKLFPVWPINQRDVYRAETEEIPKTFPLYADEDKCWKDIKMEPVQQAKTVNHKDHLFIPTIYHFPAPCEACAKSLQDVF